MRVIGLCGAKSSGKSAAASFLMAAGYVRVGMADPLKAMLATLGLTNEQLYGGAKEAHSDILCGQTTRHAMQTLGTEWGRLMIGPRIWLDAWVRSVKALGPNTNVVCDDVRFENEAALVRGFMGSVIRIDRPSLGAGTDRHSSEALDFVPDVVLTNDQDMDYLRRAILHIAAN